MSLSDYINRIGKLEFSYIVGFLVLSITALISVIFYEGNNVHSDFQEYYSTSINAVLVDSPSMRQSATRLRYKQDGYIYRFDIPLPVILDEDKSEYQLFRSFEAGDSVWKNSFSDTINIRSKGKIYTIIGNATWSEKRTISD